MGAAYCDDQEQYLEGIMAKQRTSKVMGQVSIVEPKGIHPDKSLSFFNMNESEIHGHKLQFYAWSREANGIKLITIKRADHTGPKNRRANGRRHRDWIESWSNGCQGVRQP